MDITTISIICSVVMCVIGVCTFGVGMVSRAKQDGELITKVNMSLSTLQEIKDDLKSTSTEVSNMHNMTERQDEQIKSLFTRVQAIEKRLETIADHQK